MIVYSSFHNKPYVYINGSSPIPCCPPPGPVCGRGDILIGYWTLLTPSVAPWVRCMQIPGDPVCCNITSASRKNRSAKPIMV